MLNRRAFSDVLAETPRYSRLKEDTRQIEFIRIGQALKLEAIMRGDAPTSLASSSVDGSVFKRTPWEANCFYPCFPGVRGDITAADSWADNRLVVATEEGTFVVEDGTSHRLIFDRTLQVRQLNVVEPHGILLLRAGQSNRECKIYVFRLSELERSYDQPRSRADVKDHRMEKTRGTHLYSLSRAGGSKLRMCFAIGRRVALYQWKHSAAWTAWCPSSDTDTIEGFNYLWEVVLNETPTLLTILDSGWSPNSPSHGDILLCVGYKHHWDIVNGRSGYTYHLHSVEGAKSHLVTALDLYEDQEVQLLLCYNHTCHFQKIDEEYTMSKSEYDFHWNTVPRDIVCAFPYVIGFTNECMEIRLIVNGNLVHTMTMPKLQLVAAKNDIFFATTAPEFFPNKNDRLVVDTRSTEIINQKEKTSPPSSPQHSTPDGPPLRIYRIPIYALSRNNSHSPANGGTPADVNPAHSAAAASSLLGTASGAIHTNPKNISFQQRAVGAGGNGLYYGSGSTSSGGGDTPSTPPPSFGMGLVGGSTVAWKSSDSKLSVPGGGATNGGSCSSVSGTNSLCVDPQPRVSRSATSSPVPPIKGIMKHMKM